MRKHTEYDPDLVQRLTARLHRRAMLVMVLWLLFSVPVGVYIGREMGGDSAAVIGGVAGAFLGYVVGSMRWLYYKMQALNALCLKQIEANTRAR